MNVFSFFLMALIPVEISYSNLIKRQLKHMFSFKSSHRRCSLKFHKFYRKAPVLESVLNKVAGLQACNFTKKRLQHWYFPVKFAKFSGTPILKNLCERVLLCFCSFFLMAPVFKSLLNKVASLQNSNFIKKRCQHRCFLVRFAKFLRTPKNNCERMLQ